MERVSVVTVEASVRIGGSGASGSTASPFPLSMKGGSEVIGDTCEGRGKSIGRRGSPSSPASLLCTSPVKRSTDCGRDTVYGLFRWISASSLDFFRLCEDLRVVDLEGDLEAEADMLNVGGWNVLPISEY
ncbi:hypothetical protein M378DRAFT_569385 [Amanita muscaria Koide BX008]|uniref:Uncharacterized protein n=1 Tax=Amanita muscaria (strain Koide BX008) TaxID=946122 RepID=A0A0C2WGJ6_AMAMK|nr:hypothetical protein M378DRAFT_569385 [Amanita muscaria Koide BX008]